MIRQSHIPILGLAIGATLVNAALGDAHVLDTLGTPQSKVIAIPTLDVSGDVRRQVIVERGDGDTYNGHVTTLLMPDNKTIFAAWPLGHPGPCGPLKRSDDGGLTWGPLLPTPEQWSEYRNCPAIHRLVAPNGIARLFVFAGESTMSQAVSTDGGVRWSEMNPNGLSCVVTPQTVEPIDDGAKYLMWVHQGRAPSTIWQSETTDGGLTWTNEHMLASVADADLCEPAVIRSPDGEQLLMIMRENYKRYTSLIMTSDDEGQTWSPPREGPPGLMGDRHRPRYLADGRLMMVFRDTNPESPSNTHFVAWVGTYDDVINNRQGQYRVKLLHSYAGYDCGYGGLERLPDGTMVATTYVKYKPGLEKHSIVSVRLRPGELDARAWKAARWPDDPVRAPLKQLHSSQPAIPVAESD